MAKYQVDRDTNYMLQNWGTNRLITDYGALNSNKKVSDPPTDRYSRPCGGKGGFDDFVERWHE
jgi:hypothetical protein